MKKINTSKTNLLIAEKVFGWSWQIPFAGASKEGDCKQGPSMFTPPFGDPKLNWAASWNIDGIPDYLPDYENEGEIVWIKELGKHVRVTVEILDE